MQTAASVSRPDHHIEMFAQPLKKGSQSEKDFEPLRSHFSKISGQGFCTTSPGQDPLKRRHGMIDRAGWV
jgi:hypothetical protein